MKIDKLEVLKDRRDYRQALIHRIETAKSKERKIALATKLKAVEEAISVLKES